jgi:hypothetical protein
MKLHRLLAAIALPASIMAQASPPAAQLPTQSTALRNPDHGPIPAG